MSTKIIFGIYTKNEQNHKVKYTSIDTICNYLINLNIIHGGMSIAETKDFIIWCDKVDGKYKFGLSKIKV